MNVLIRCVVCLTVIWACGVGRAQAQSDLPAPQFNALKQKLAQRMPEMAAIESARTTPVAGLIEIRAGNTLAYTDLSGDHLIEGNLIDTRTQRNLTEARLDEINKVDVANLPLGDALVWKSGTGKRHLIVFADPNCGYCKQLERELQKVKDVTVYTFLIPILADDSRTKLDNVWCTKDRIGTWQNWMLSGVQPPKAFGMCASPAQRNLALAQRLRVNGTPSLFFEDGSRLASALSAAALEDRLAHASANASANAGEGSKSGS